MLTYVNFTIISTNYVSIAIIKQLTSVAAIEHKLLILINMQIKLFKFKARSRLATLYIATHHNPKH